MVGFVFCFDGRVSYCAGFAGWVFDCAGFLRCGVPRLEQAGGTTESEGPSRTGEL